MKRKSFMGSGARLLASATLLATFGLAAPSQAAELVFNGGFETGNFAGWTQGGNTSFTGVGTTTVHSGTYSAFLGPQNTPGTLSQLINTIAGNTYDVGFWIQNDGGTPNSFTATFGGNPVLFSLNNSGAFEYEHHTFTAIGDAPTLLQFTFQQNPAWWHLDDVSVQGDPGPGILPEPGTWAMMLLGFGGMGALMRRRRATLTQLA